MSAVWGSVLMTALTDVAATSDGSQLTIDDLSTRLQEIYTQFTGLTKGLSQPV